MRRIFGGLTAIFLCFSGGQAIAENPISENRTIYERNTDLTGTDLANIFDTTQEACERACLNTQNCRAFTFNQRSNSCFPKSDITGAIQFDGALSGLIFPTDANVLAQADARAEELDFLGQNTLYSVQRLFDQSHQTRNNTTSRQRDAFLRAQNSDVATDWLAFSRVADSSSSTGFRSLVMPATVRGYLISLDAETRRRAAVSIAIQLEDQGNGRRMIDALRLAQSIEFRELTERNLDEAIGKYGFRVADTAVESDSVSPRVCATFNEELIQAGTDYTPFVQLPEPQMVVTVSTNQLCIEGVTHGERYRFVLREGLPAASGEKMIKPVELTLYVRDRSPAVRFVSRAYVLPRVGDVGIPLETVNMTEVDLKLSRIDDRNLMRTVQSGIMDRSLSRYSTDFVSPDFGVEVWSGSATVMQELNRDTLTRLPLEDALRDEPAGLYALTAASTDGNRDIASATQWFVLSDIGVATYLGTDGLTVAARSLSDAKTIRGAEVTLISRSNAVLATADTGRDGTVHFAEGLTRGTGGNAPALVTVADGDDMTYLSLTDPAFDLSDRGVKGREPSPPIDVFLATDRGAYRAGETIHLTSLMRDPSALALPDIPLTAVLTRPDGVEYRRTTSTQGNAGGHVFALPVADTAPRGTWRIAVFADEESPALASDTVLVEDFLPERIDFDIVAPEQIELGDAPTLRIDARYLFGAVGADLDVEGEALLRPARALDGFQGFQFGQYDVAFDPQQVYLPNATTDDTGVANVTIELPLLEVGQPLDLRVTARVKEGSGRPVERQITAPVLPSRPMIGIKPMFDGVIAEDTSAPFQLIGLNPDLTAANIEVQWSINKVTTRYQWYSLNGRWDWEPTTSRTTVATGKGTLGDVAINVAADVSWGSHEIVVQTTSGPHYIASAEFYAGWYAPASVDDTPDLLEASLDAESYAVGDTAIFRIVPRYEGNAVVTVMSDRLISMKTVRVKEGENLIDLDVTEEWGAGAYVSASVIRPMNVRAGRNPARALGIGYAQVDPGKKALDVTLSAPDVMEPRGAIDIGVQVDGVAAGETAYVTLAAVDVGILNLTGFETPDPQDHYFGQRKLGVEMRDVYGRLIDGLNGAMGTVRSGGDAAANSGVQSPPPTEELVTFFTGPVEIDRNGQATVSFELPAFNGTLRLMAVAWSETGVGQAERDVIVRDPVVVTASVPRFLAPNDQSRMLLEIIHADGPTGDMTLEVSSYGVLLIPQLPPSFTLNAGAKATFEVPLIAQDPGTHSIEIVLTTPDGRRLTKQLTMPVVVNDPETSRISRFNLASGNTFSFADNVFDGLIAGTGRATLSAGPLARLDAPGLLSALDRYPYSCTEQMTSRAMPLLYLESVATTMGLADSEEIQERIAQFIIEITANQSGNGAFGLWRPGSGDMWLDAYVTDFLSRARAEGHVVPDVAYENAVSNLRNRVNYYPDFDEGGRDLAYALFVLAREGAAAVSDLRYYADEKPGAFNSPMAVAQLGAALAQYGDQPRADAMFSRAGRLLEASFAREEARLWRSDYGTNRRDAAAVLALATEAGSDAINRDSLLTRVGNNASRASTQEAAWTLLAAKSLDNDLRGAGITVDGQRPDGPIVQLRDAEAQQAPVAIYNGSGTATDITLTTFGVPSVPEPAGGNGYAIRRNYVDFEGRQIDMNSVAAGTRLITILTVSPFGRQEARLMVNDPLPAGFEIDNPNLMSGGDVPVLDGLNLANAQNTEFRSDRFLAAIDWRSDKDFQLAYVVRAVSPGQFHHPAASVEDMYRPQMRAHTDTTSLTITP